MESKVIRIRKYKIFMRKTGWGQWWIVKDGLMIGCHKKPLIAILRALITLIYEATDDSCQ